MSTEFWLQGSLEALRDEGIAGVRVEHLVRDLQVTNGSFYRHFTDRDDLITSLLDARSIDEDPTMATLAVTIMIREHSDLGRRIFPIQ